VNLELSHPIALTRDAVSRLRETAADYDAVDVSDYPWPTSLRVAGYITCAGAAIGIGLQAGANHPDKLAAVLAGSAAFTLAFHWITALPNVPRPRALLLAGAQLAIALGMFLVGCTGAELLLFVLAAECQLVLPLLAAFAATAGLWLLTVVVVALGHVSLQGESWGQFIATSPAGFAFVAAFTYNALGERRLRIQATQLLDELNQAHEQLQLYADQVEELTVARERNRIAGEIHDTLGHYLTVVNIQLETAQKLLDRSPQAARDAVITAKSQADEALSEVRRSVAALGPKALELGFPEALVRFVDSLRRSTNLKIHVDTHSGTRLRPEVEVVAYRVIQEALTNVRKHAGARNVWVRLEWDDDSFHCSIRDDGRGVDHLENQDSFGLQSMRERVGGAGGWLKTESSPGHGFLVEFHIPAPAIRPAAAHARAR
jgi:signal transduction histidine kinase